MKAIIKNISDHELICKCGCGFNEVSNENIIKIQQLRTMCGFPFVFRSCCRCKLHNKNVDGRDNSEHLTCDGFDIVCLTSNQKFILVSNAINLGFNRIGIYKDFVHLGTSKKHPQNVLWYGK